MLIDAMCFQYKSRNFNYTHHEKVITKGNMFCQSWSQIKVYVCVMEDNKQFTYYELYWRSVKWVHYDFFPQCIWIIIFLHIHIKYAMIYIDVLLICYPFVSVTVQYVSQVSRFPVSTDETKNTIGTSRSSSNECVVIVQRIYGAKNVLMKFRW